MAAAAATQRVTAVRASVCSGAAGQRGDAEGPQPDEHDASVAVQVVDGAAGEHQAGQRDGIAVHHLLRGAGPHLLD